MSRPTRKGLETSDLTCRLADCQGAVSLAIEGILTGDPDQISAAVGSLSLAAGELGRLKNDIDRAEFAGTKKTAVLTPVN